MAQLVLPLANRPALGREDFIVGPANRDAVSFVDAYPNWPAAIAALHGPPGSGKSHLAAIWAARAGAETVAASAIDAAVVERARPVAIEDVDTAPADAAREALIFTLIERGTPVLLSGRAPPAQWASLKPDLASRYRALLAFALWTPDDDLLRALARKLFTDRQLQVPDAAIAQMINSLERSPAAIRDFVARADELALSRKRAVSPALIRELLSETPANPA